MSDEIVWMSEYARRAHELAYLQLQSSGISSLENCNCEIEDDEKETYELTGHCLSCCPNSYMHDEYADYKSKNDIPEGWECQDFPDTDAVGCKWWDISSQGVIMEHDSRGTFYYIKPGVNVKAFMKGIEDYVKSLPPA